MTLLGGHHRWWPNTRPLEVATASLRCREDLCRTPCGVPARDANERISRWHLYTQPAGAPAALLVATAGITAGASPCATPCITRADITASRITPV
jgi:hypothetical protein